MNNDVSSTVPTPDNTQPAEDPGYEYVIIPTHENQMATLVLAGLTALTRAALGQLCIKCNGPVSQTKYDRGDPLYALCDSHIENQDLVLPEYPWATVVNDGLSRVQCVIENGRVIRKLRAVVEQRLTAECGAHGFRWLVTRRHLRSPFVTVQCDFINAEGNKDSRECREVVPAQASYEASEAYQLAVELNCLATLGRGAPEMASAS